MNQLSLPLVLSCTGLLIAAGAASARPLPAIHRVNYVADFDQGRSSEVGIPGLPNNGSMYCGPTSTTNWMNYIANRGYPSVLPGPGYLGAASGDTYNWVTAVVAAMGGEMNTSPEGGTGSNGLIAGAEAFLESTYPGSFVVGKYSCGTGACPTFQNIAETSLNGSLVTFVYGRYATEPGAPDDVYFRQSGHIVSYNGFDNNMSGQFIRYRDPGSGAPNTTTQSAYVSSVQRIEMITLNLNNTLRTLPWFADVTGYRLIDGVFTITPKFGLTTCCNNLAIQTMEPGHVLPSMPSSKTFASPNGAPILDACLHPQLNQIAVITAALPGAGGGGDPPKLWLVSRADGAASEALTLNGPGAMYFGRYRELFFTDGQMLVKGDWDQDGTFAEVQRVTLGGPLAGLTYDDSTDTVCCISSAAGTLTRFQRDLSQPPIVDPLPGGLILAGAVHACVSPVDGTLFIADSAAGEVIQLGRDAAGALEVRSMLVDAALVGMGRPHVGAEGHLILSAGGIVREYEYVRTGWEPVLLNRFDGYATSSIVDFASSRNDYTPGIDDDESETTNFDPSGEIATQAPDCNSDLNLSGVVDFGDITKVLANFGQAELMGDPGDADGDGDADFADVTRILMDWAQVCL